MSKFQEHVGDVVKSLIRNAAGSVFYLSTNVVAGTIGATAQNITDNVSNGRLALEDIILTTSNGMLVTGGTVRIIKNGGGGTAFILQVSTNDLGSNRTVNFDVQNFRVANWGGVGQAAYVRDHDQYIARPTILDQGYRLQIDLFGTAASGANNGTVRVLAKFRRIDDNATTSVTNAVAYVPGL